MNLLLDPGGLGRKVRSQFRMFHAIKATTRIHQDVQWLPIDIQRQARAAYRHFKKNPFHPGLHFKPIRDDIYSVRIGISYRAVGVRDGDLITWFWIGPHDQYDKLLKKR